jgi:hypothetical protein
MAKHLNEIADRLEAETFAGQVTNATLADAFNLEVRCEGGPVDDPVLGPQTVSIRSLGPIRSLLPSRHQPSRRLVSATPRKREHRAGRRRSTRAGPARPDDPDPVIRPEVVA